MRAGNTSAFAGKSVWCMFETVIIDLVNLFVRLPDLVGSRALSS